MYAASIPIIDASPRRIPRALAAEEVDRHRHLACPEYEECLERAAAGSWQSFSCAACPRMPRRDGALELAEFVAEKRGTSPHSGLLSVGAVAEVLGEDALTFEELADRIEGSTLRLIGALDRGRELAIFAFAEGRWRITGNKRCVACHQVQPLSAYYRSGHGSLGVDAHCRACRREEKRITKERAADA